MIKLLFFLLTLTITLARIQHKQPGVYVLTKIRPHDKIANALLLKKVLRLVDNAGIANPFNLEIGRYDLLTPEYLDHMDEYQGKERVIQQLHKWFPLVEYLPKEALRHYKWAIKLIGGDPNLIKIEMVTHGVRYHIKDVAPMPKIQTGKKNTDEIQLKLDLDVNDIFAAADRVDLRIYVPVNIKKSKLPDNNSNKEEVKIILASSAREIEENPQDFEYRLNFEANIHNPYFKVKGKNPININTLFTVALNEHDLKVKLNDFSFAKIADYVEKNPHNVELGKERTEIKEIPLDLFGYKAFINTSTIAEFFGVKENYDLVMDRIKEAFIYALRHGAGEVLLESFNKSEWQRNYAIEAFTEKERKEYGLDSSLLSQVFVKQFSGHKGMDTIQIDTPVKFCNTKQKVSETFEVPYTDSKGREKFKKKVVERCPMTQNFSDRPKSRLTQLTTDNAVNDALRRLEELDGHMAFVTTEDQIQEYLIQVIDDGYFDEMLAENSIELGPKKVIVRFNKPNGRYSIYVDALYSKNRSLLSVALGTPKVRFPLVFEGSFSVESRVDETGLSRPHIITTFESVDLTHQTLMYGVPEEGLPGLKTGDRAVRRFAKLVKSIIINLASQFTRSELDPKTKERLEKKDAKNRKFKLSRDPLEIPYPYDILDGLSLSNALTIESNGDGHMYLYIKFREED